MKTILTIVIFALSINAFAQDTIKTQVITKKLTVTGTIKNFDEVVKLANSQSYIQLVPIKDGVIWTSFKFSEGHLSNVYYDSDLTKLPIPKQAIFSYKCDSIAPGLYFLAVQGIRSDWKESQEGPMLLTDQGNLYTITISSDANPIIGINAGTLTVRIKQ
jgi:hypothetical protein